MIIGQKEFKEGRHTYVMGILNVTPDSFSDGGRYQLEERAVAHAQQMLADGADVIDVGGESTRPGYIPVSEEEEIERVCGVIERLRREFAPVISIDTYKSRVAEEAVRAGAALINDIWGFRRDRKMASVAKKYQTACCLMHNREQAVYSDLMQEICEDLKESLRIARAAGVMPECIMIDPGIGIGFGKTLEQNLEVIQRLDELHKLGCPLLLGTSRKSVIGQTLGLPVNERVEGTLATTAYAVMSGCLFVRVHDVKENVRFIKMMEAISGVSDNQKE